MHKWGDSNVDWQGIEEAARYIGDWLRTYARMDVSDIKEKYGTPRVSCIFGWWQFHTIFYPGYMYRQGPVWLWNLDIVIGMPICRILNKIIMPIHIKLYQWRYKKAIKKWPHLKAELLTGCDHPNLLEHLGSKEFWEWN